MPVPVFLRERRVCTLCRRLAQATACGHVFCYEHIQKWLRNDETCPTCRSVISGMSSLVELFDIECVEDGEGKEGRGDESDSGLQMNGVLQSLDGLKTKWESLLQERAVSRRKLDDLEDEVQVSPLHLPACAPESSGRCS